MQRSNRRRTALASITALALLAGACGGRDDGEVGGEDTPSTEESTTPDGGNRLDAGQFGDLTDVCQDGDASGATDVGVTDTSIQVGTLTDKGFSFRQGLNREMHDTAVAFAEWCNSLGGINGRELIIADRDSAMTEYTNAITEACDGDFALVGGGSVLDDSDNGLRIECGLPNISGYVVSATAREADLQVQPLPNPTNTLSFGAFQLVAEENPELIDRFGVITASFGSVIGVRDDTVAAAEALGYNLVYSGEYNPTGEPDWRPFAEQMRSADVQVFEFIGEPTFFGQLLQALEEIDYRPAVMLQQANFYDDIFRDTSAAVSDNVRVRIQFTPMELAEENEATADYLELMDRYNPDGKKALLGMQGLSAFLLFAKSAAACGSELTRECILEQAGAVEEWTAGGLHAPQNPAANLPSPCFVSLDVTADGFVPNEEATRPTDGIFNCDPDNVVTAR